MKRIECGDLALAGDRHNWTVQAWVPVAPGRPYKGELVTRADGSVGRWRDVAYHGRLRYAVDDLHDRLVRAGDAGTLDGLVCAVDDAAGAIVAALDRLQLAGVAP